MLSTETIERGNHEVRAFASGESRRVQDEVIVRRVCGVDLKMARHESVAFPILGLELFGGSLDGDGVLALDSFNAVFDGRHDPNAKRRGKRQSVGCSAPDNHALPVSGQRKQRFNKLSEISALA